MTLNWKKITPHLIAIGVFLIVALIYCKPALQGKVLQQSDIIHWKGMAQNSFKYKETHGHYPLWTNSMFSGMPAYQIAMDPQNPFNLFYLHKLFTLFLSSPFSFFFLLCICFYFLTQVLNIDYRLGTMGGLAYAYASFSSILVVAGHETQVQAMAYMAALLGAIILVYRKRYWPGAALTALFTGLLIAVNHLQITYYFLIIAGFMTVYYIIQWIKAKQYRHLIKSLAIVAVTGLLGVASNLVILATTYDYSKATMRNGVLELDSAQKNTQASGGLPIDYAFRWSFQKSEVLSILVPNIYGGISGGYELGKDSHLATMATQNGVPEEQVTQFTAAFPAYWGEQPFTSGPVYFGAIMCFLFLFGMIYLKRKDKWWILAVSILAVMMSWGRFFPAFNDFLFYHLPLYNKFRVPTYTLAIPQFLFPLLAVITLQQLFFLETEKNFALKKLKTSGYVMLGVFAIVAMLYTSFTYTSSADDSVISQLTQMTGGNKDAANSFYNALKEDRQSLFGKDILRSLLFAAAAFACLWLYLKNKLKASYALIALVLLSSIDVLAEGRRYLNDNRFQAKGDEESQNFSPSTADQQILQDTGYYRVLNLTADVFNDALTSYFHNSIGGYHPAKLAIIQDLLTYQLSDKMNINVLNMLNTKYVITRGQQNEPVVQQNPEALGPCWFVKHISYVKDDAAAMKALDNNHAADTAIIEESEKSKIPFAPGADSTARITLVKNDNDVIDYSSISNSNQFAVFSEIYYDRGWKAYIDNKEAPIVRANYALRGLAVPAGNHHIRFEFKPQSFYGSEKIAIAASAAVWLLLGASAFVVVRKKKMKQAA